MHSRFLAPSSSAQRLLRQARQHSLSVSRKSPADLSQWQNTSKRYLQRLEDQFQFDLKQEQQRRQKLQQELKALDRRVAPSEQKFSSPSSKLHKSILYSQIKKDLTNPEQKKETKQIKEIKSSTDPPVQSKAPQPKLVVKTNSAEVQLNGQQVVCQAMRDRLTFSNQQSINYSSIKFIEYTRSNTMNVICEISHSKVSYSLGFKNGQNFTAFQNLFYGWFSAWRKQSGRLFQGLFEPFVEKPKDVRDQQWVQEGVKCVKYAVGSVNPKQKWLFVNKQKTRLVWCPEEKRTEQKFIQLVDIKDVVLGRKTLGFVKFDKEKTKKKLQQLETMSLTVRSQQPDGAQRLVELQFKSREERDRLHAFLLGLRTKAKKMQVQSTIK